MRTGVRFGAVGWRRGPGRPACRGREEGRVLRGGRGAFCAALALAWALMPMPTRLWWPLAAPCLARAGADTATGDGRVPAAVPFGVGERLEFEVSYNVLRAGTASLSVEAVQDINGYPCYALVSTAGSNSFVSTFYEVRDTVRSFMDVVGLFSRGFERHLKEGRYVKDEVVVVDQERGLAYYDDGDTVEIQAMTQDALSSLYFVRTLDLKVGSLVAFPNHTGKKNYPLRVRVLGRENVRTPAGRFRCLVVEPRLKTAGIFKHEGRLTVWLSDDERKLPVKMKSQIKIGSVTATLIRWRKGRPVDLGQAVEASCPRREAALGTGADPGNGQRGSEDQ